MAYSVTGFGAAQTAISTMTSAAYAPPAHPGCVTDDERARAKADCTSGSIKGLGAVPYPSGHRFAGMDPCIVKDLPACPKAQGIAIPFTAKPTLPTFTPLTPVTPAGRGGFGNVGLIALLAALGIGGTWLYMKKRRKAA